MESCTASPTQPNSLILMLRTLEEQDIERRRCAGPLAASLLRVYASKNKARERAQVRAHEAFLRAKANNSQGGINRLMQQEDIKGCKNRNIEVPADPITKKNDVAMQNVGASPSSPCRCGRHDPRGKKNVRIHNMDMDERARPVSKAESLCADLLTAAIHATK